MSNFDTISREQIRRQLAKPKPYKAPGSNGMPNIVLTKCTTEHDVKGTYSGDEGLMAQTPSDCSAIYSWT
jgi:hypothetical protein